MGWKDAPIVSKSKWQDAPVVSAKRDLKAENPGEYDPNSEEFKAKYGSTSGTGFGQRFVEGIGSGLTDIVKGAGNLVGAVSDDELRSKKELDQELLSTGGGAIGNMVGQTAATLPVGGAVSQGARLLSTASRAAPMLARTLGSAPVRSAVEGAIGGALSAGPDDQGTGALLGGAAGGGLTALGKTLSRLNRGLVEKSGAADTLQTYASQHGEDLFVPVSQAAKPDGDVVTRATAGVYRGALPFVPGVAGKVEGQADTARQVVRRLAAKESDPTGILQHGMPDEPSVVKKILGKEFDKEYLDTVKSYAFNVSPTFRDDVVSRIKKDIPNVDDVTANKIATMVDEKMARYSNNGSVIDGDNLLQAKNDFSREIGKLSGREKQAAVSAHKIFNETIDSELRSGNSKQNIADLARFNRANDSWSNFTAYGKAVNAAKANGGEFSMNQLARATAGKGGAMETLGQDANRVLGKRATGGDPQGRFITGAALGGYALFSPENIARAATTFTGAQALATRKAQEFVLGDTAVQQAIAKSLRKHAKALGLVGQVGRTAAATSAGDF